MVNQWTVLSRLRQIATLDEEGTAAGLSLCLICLEEIRTRLKDDVDAHDPGVERAAAGLAFYKLILKRITLDGAVTRFKAGDVSVSQDSRGLLAVAEKVRDEAIAAAAPLLKDELFLFKQVDA
ncbi:MAG: hypothetical protein GXZ02_05705 [Clostridiales bacterium]|nr:hypothetical protein [Clostridiales bacterium]